MKGSVKVGLACLVLTVHFTSAQSTYSFFGLGSLNHHGMPNNMGMGEVGIGTPVTWHINTQNPANLAFNNLSTFQIGLESDNRKFSGNGLSGSAFDAQLRYLGYAFPVMQGKWSSSIGIIPISTVNYTTVTERSIIGDTDPTTLQAITESGDGGLTNFHWSNGFFVAKKIFLGVRFNYTFGSINNEGLVSILREREDGNIGRLLLSSSSRIEQTSYSDLNFSFGSGYQYSLGDSRYLYFGIIYAPTSRLNGYSNVVLNRLSSNGRVSEVLDISRVKVSFDLPRILGFGVSYQKLNSYTVGIDVESQPWNKSRQSNREFRNLFKVATGISWVPDFDAINSYLKRATYRMGFNYLQTPYVVKGESINDFGINFGISLPVSGYSSFDLAFKYGQTGTTANGLIKEDYYKIVIGATINDQWFVKRKYD